MSDVKRVEKINRLLDIYGRLLTKSQFEIMSDYYYCDLSLSEISEIRKITRTAVSDAIKNATKKLENYEQKLGVCRVFDSMKSSENSKLIDEIEERIKDGIWVIEWKISAHPKED